MNLSKNIQQFLIEILTPINTINDMNNSIHEFIQSQSYPIIQIPMQVLSILLLILASHTKSLPRSSCPPTQILDTRTLSCIECPPLMQPNINQKIPTSCICISGYYQNGVNSCVSWSNTTPCQSNQFLDIVTDSGLYTIPAGVNCSNCSSNAYPNKNGTGCIPCPRQMVFNYSCGLCQCLSNSSSMSYIQTSQGCFNSSQIALTSHIRISDSVYYEHLKYLLPSCFYFRDLLSCSFLINLCVYSIGYGSVKEEWCGFGTEGVDFRSYLQFDLSQQYFYMKPGALDKKRDYRLKFLVYLSSGNLVQEKSMKFSQIFQCIDTDNRLNIHEIVKDIALLCTFDNANFISKIGMNPSKSSLYQILLLGDDAQYHLIAIYLGSSSIPVKRFFLEDRLTPRNIQTEIKLTLSLNESGYLISPSLFINYEQLDSGGVSESRLLESGSQVVDDIQTFWRVFIAIFITVNAIVLIQSLARTYIAYLNRQSVLGFFYYIANFWSLWMFYFLIVISGYWFLLYYTKNIDVVEEYFNSSKNKNFYVAFYVVAALMGFFRVVTVIYDKKDKLGYEMFMINWEKGKNSWREIFIINSLAEFYTYRTVSFFWMLLWELLFLVGLGVQDRADINKSEGNHFPTRDRIFLYFLSGSIFLVIGIVFKILRRITVIVWPYPFEDFVDYCNVTNISFFFMKKRSLEAYYLHASIPDKTEVTYKQINDAIRRGLNKNRNIMKQHSFHQGQRMYVVYICKELQEKFNTMIKKCEDEKQEKLSKHNNKSKQESRKKLKIYTNPREQFIQKKLKPYLDIIMRDGPRNTKTFINRFFGIPEIDLRDPTVLKNANHVIFDSNLDIVSDVFPNGNQFEQIHSLIIIFLMFLLMTANISAAAVLSYFVYQFMIDQWIASTCRQNLQAMTKVQIGFML